MDTEVIADRGRSGKRVLVAGATGYLGSHVLKELKSRGYFVRALARRPHKASLYREHMDELYMGEVTMPDTLRGVCGTIDVVFSAVGITRQRGALSFHEVDYQGNKNLLEEARRSGVKKFVYVSSVDGPELTHLDIVKAHEDFVEELKASGLEYTIVRPTGFFSDMGEVFNMARKGRVYLFGEGDRRINPIHGEDLAARCVDAIEGEAREMEVGGPETMTWREVAELAFKVLGKPAKITCIPAWVMGVVVAGVRLFSRHSAGLIAFFTTMATRDVLAPATGTRTLRAHFESLRRRGTGRGDPGSNRELRPHAGALMERGVGRNCLQEM